MKLSQMTTNQATDALCKIAPAVMRVLADQSTLPLVQQLFDAFKSEHPAETAAAVCIRIFPLLLKDHKEDMFEIVGALNDKTAQQIAKQNVMKTIEMVRDSVDKELIDFFKSSGEQTQTIEN